MAAGLFAVGSFELLRSPDPGLRSHRPAGLLLLLLAMLGVAIRRKAPWVGLTAALLAAVISLTADIPYAIGNGAFVAELVVLYTVAERSGPAGSAVALVATVLIDGLVERLVYQVSIPLDIQADVPYIVLAWFAGWTQRRRHAVGTDLERGVIELEKERARLARTAVANERSRIARELHALVVRGVEQMTAQTRAARHRLAVAMRRTSLSLDAIEATGRSTLVEMRRLVSLLRTSDEALPANPGRASSQAWGVETAGPTGPPKIMARMTLWGRQPAVVDAFVVLGMAALAADEIVTKPYGYFGRPVDIALGVLVVGVLWFRRRHALLVLAAVGTSVFVWNAFLNGDPYTADRAMLAAVFSAAAFRGPAWAFAAIGAQIVAYAPLAAIPGTCDISCQAAWTPLFVFAAVAGLAVREAGRLTEQLTEQSEILRRTRAERVRMAVTEERTRVARDLHDMVAHGVTVMVVQAGAASALVATDPARAERALTGVERAGRDALRELGSLVESLGWRGGANTESLAETELHSVAELVEQAKSEGLLVELMIEGDPGPVDPGLGVSLYRVVQEALTNVRKHAPGARAWVQVRYLADGVEVDVTDTGPVAQRPREGVPGAGLGLIGISERVALFRGHAEAGPTAEGGFRVHARLARDRVAV
jgi:signal transduction histidine kinase